MCRGQQQGRHLGEAQGSDEVESQNRARTMDFHFLLRADSAPVDDIPADASSFKEFFSEYRKRKIRRPDVLIKRGLPVLKKSGHEGVDLWSLLEALFLAAFDVGDKTLASMCLERLVTEFPESVRVGILKGRKLEMEGQLAAAMTLYESLLEKQMQNQLLSQRDRGKRLRVAPISQILF